VRLRVQIQPLIATRRREMEENSLKRNTSNGEEEILEDTQRGQLW
jgi:hypothetical protein